MNRESGFLEFSPGLPGVNPKTVLLVKATMMVMHRCRAVLGAIFVVFLVCI